MALGKTSALACGVLALLWSASSALRAQPWLEDGRSCFCLRHEMGKVIHNCTGVKPPSDSYVTATCRGGETGDQLTLLAVEPPWTPIRDGETGCSPCRSVRPTTKVPRGNDSNGPLPAAAPAVQPRAPILDTAYDLLYKFGGEASGYGLYSYVILLGSSDRDSAFIETMIKSTPAAQGLQWPHDQINLLLLPTVKVAQSDRASCGTGSQKICIQTPLGDSRPTTITPREVYYINSARIRQRLCTIFVIQRLGRDRFYSPMAILFRASRVFRRHSCLSICRQLKKGPLQNTLLRTKNKLRAKI